MTNAVELPLPEELPPDHRSGFVALMGKPNVGKSTLLNAWLGIKISAVSPKPQTTRTRLLGILTRPDAQVIFVDTPGIHQPKNKLGDFMVQAAKRALPDSDLVLFIVDVSRPPSEEDEQVARLFRGCEVPVFLVLNKTDLISGDRLEANQAAYEALGHFDEVMRISALTGYNREELLEKIIARLPLGPRYYPEDQLTDQQERFIAAELIREQVLRFLEQEVPHAIAIVIQEFKERPNGMLYISAYIYTEKESQKGIVIGRKGAMLKRIGQEARKSLEAFFERRVYLDLWVKVRKNWRRKEHYLREFGFSPH
ncbi:MAG: GTPase Era [Anaerolineae bacterium]|nr:GTPase Era [Anaerolineae bacterium]